jgi:hypothetical protein
MDQIPVQPKPIPASLITAQYLGFTRQTKTPLGQLNLSLNTTKIPSQNRPLPRLLTKPNRKTQLPFLLAQFKSKIQIRLISGILFFAGC